MGYCLSLNWHNSRMSGLSEERALAQLDKSLEWARFICDPGPACGESVSVVLPNHPPAEAYLNGCLKSRVNTLCDRRVPLRLTCGNCDQIIPASASAHAETASGVTL